MRGDTFHESWFKVQDLHPQMHMSLRVHRQHYRGELWYVIRDSSNNQFFRLNESAYRFLALLDGQHSVDDAWNTCQTEFVDEAPTQGEALAMLGQLYAADLLQGDVPADTGELLKRHRKRLRQKATGTLKSLLFARIPLLNPDRFLDKWCFLFAPVFNPVAYSIAILALLAAGAFLVSNIEELASEAGNVLSLSQMPLLYAAFLVTKIVHEFAHGFACKYYGRQRHKKGDVQEMGISLLLLTPVPYVDASSSWSLSSKWQRVAIAAAGMYAELLIAAICAIVWANTGSGDVVHVIAFEVMLICSVTTILFNGNPLLRFDAYYMLSDILEIPNLSTRSKIHLKYLFRRYFYRLESAESSHSDFREALILTTYGLAAEIYRFFLVTSIVVFLAYLEPFLGIAAFAVYFYSAVMAPVLTWVRYVFFSEELSHRRGRAVCQSSMVVVLFLYLISGVKVSEYSVSEGVIEPEYMAQVYFQGQGFARNFDNRERAVVEGEELVSCSDPELKAEILKVKAQRAENAIARKAYFSEDLAKSMIYGHRVAMLDDRLDALEEEKKYLTLKSPLSGIFIPNEHVDLSGTYIRKGQHIGQVCSSGSLFVRSVINQDQSRILAETNESVEIRLKGRPDIQLRGRVRKLQKFGSRQLPSTALGYAGGGELEVDNRGDGRETRSHFFEIIIDIVEGEKISSLRSGQVVVIRYSLEEKSLFEQMSRYVSRQFLKVMRI